MAGSEGYQILEDHRSPDGMLRLSVVCDSSRDTTIGFTDPTAPDFTGCMGHTHGDILANLSGQSVEQAIRRYVDDVLNDCCIIGVSQIAGVIDDVWVADDPRSDLKHKLAEETLLFRRWSGVIVEAFDS